MNRHVLYDLDILSNEKNLLLNTTNQGEFDKNPFNYFSKENLTQSCLIHNFFTFLD
jgi:hypothetical protein